MSEKELKDLPFEERERIRLTLGFAMPVAGIIPPCISLALAGVLTGRFEWALFFVASLIGLTSLSFKEAYSQSEKFRRAYWIAQIGTLIAALFIFISFQWIIIFCPFFIFLMVWWPIAAYREMHELLLREALAKQYA